MTEVRRMEQKNSYFEERPFPFIEILYKRWLFILLVTILSVMLGLLYGLINVRTMYTAKSSVILRMSVDGETDSSSIVTNVSLSRIYIDDIAEIIIAPEMINVANSNYNGGEGRISSSSIKVDYNHKSLIFQVSYTDVSETAAKEKLKTLINSASAELPDIVEAASRSLIPTQNESMISKKNDLGRYPMLGFMIGLVAGVVISLLIYVLDTTIKDRMELEELTGICVLSQLDEIGEKEEK